MVVEWSFAKTRIKESVLGASSMTENRISIPTMMGGKQESFFNCPVRAGGTDS